MCCLCDLCLFVCGRGVFFMCLFVVRVIVVVVFVCVVVVCVCDCVCFVCVCVLFDLFFLL